jgi:hypothetical protein
MTSSQFSWHKNSAIKVIHMLARVPWMNSIHKCNLCFLQRFSKHFPLSNLHVYLYHKSLVLNLYGFTSLHVVQTGSGAHPAFYPVGTGDSFLGGKAARAWSWPLTSN